jgi:hypothetical protein
VCAAAVTGALVILGACRPANAQAAGCTKDTDCKGTRVCESGRCVDPPPAAEAPAPVGPPPCQKDTDCAGDLVCENSACVVAGAAPVEQGAAAAEEPPQAEPEMAAPETEPPEPEYEEPPPQPDPAAVWLQGFWDWYYDQWVWRGGMWRVPPAGTVYVPPHYEVVRGRVAYTRGYWGSAKARPRVYGGRVLKFKPAVRPGGYVRGARPIVKPSPGLKVGKRPVASYKWSGKPTAKFVVPPPKPKPVVRPTNLERRPLPPVVRPPVRPGHIEHKTSPTPVRPTNLEHRTPPRPLGLDSKEGTRCR